MAHDPDPFNDDVIAAWDTRVHSRHDETAPRVYDDRVEVQTWCGDWVSKRAVAQTGDDIGCRSCITARTREETRRAEFKEKLEHWRKTGSPIAIPNSFRA